jgi:hypothetical protein
LAHGWRRACGAESGPNIPARFWAQAVATMPILQKCNTMKRTTWIVELLDACVRDELEALPADMKARFLWEMRMRAKTASRERSTLPRKAGAWLWSGEESLRFPRTALLNFGELLTAWPELVSGAQSLRDEGIRISVPL